MNNLNSKPDPQLFVAPKPTLEKKDYSGIKFDIPDSDELTREIVKSLQAKTESDLRIYMENKIERDKIITLLQSTCRHAYIWVNDPHYHSLHECRKCGKMEAVIRPERDEDIFSYIQRNKMEKVQKDLNRDISNNIY